MLADMATEIDAARLLVRKAAWKQDSGARFTLEAPSPSFLRRKWPRASRTKPCRFTAAMATAANIPSRRMYRDARITEIYEGTSEIQRLIIASAVLRKYSFPK